MKYDAHMKITKAAAVLAQEPVHPRGLSLTLTGAPVRGGGALGVLVGRF
jgi:hypothetical protein